MAAGENCSAEEKKVPVVTLRFLNACETACAAFLSWLLTLSRIAHL
jgi:hypothetical protein